MEAGRNILLSYSIIITQTDFVKRQMFPLLGTLIPPFVMVPRLFSFLQNHNLDFLCSCVIRRCAVALRFI